MAKFGQADNCKKQWTLRFYADRLLYNLIQHYCLTGRSNQVTDYIKKGEEIFDLCEFHNYRSLFLLARNVYLMDKERSRNNFHFSSRNFCGSFKSF